MASLTNQAQTLLTGLSDFWQRLFADRDILNALYAATEVQLGQAYLDMVTQVLNANLGDIPLFNKEYWYLLTVRQDQVRYDASSNTWNLKLTDKLRGANFLLNRIYDPTVALEVDIDFDIDAPNDVLRFFSNPFNSANGVASREVDIAPTVFRRGSDGGFPAAPDQFVTRGVTSSGRDGAFPANNSFVSLSASFNQDDVGRVLSHPAGGVTLERTILGVIDAHTLVLDGTFTSATTTASWEVRDTTYFTQFDVGTQIRFEDPTAQNRELVYTIESVDSGLQVTFTEETVFNPADKETLEWTHQSPTRVTELSYWVPDALFDRENLWLSFGYLLNRYEPSSESYRALLQGIFRYFILGPSLRRIESALNVISGIPVARQDGEVIASITTSGSADVIVTDVEVYRLPSGSVDPALSEGDTLEAFQPLSTVFTVEDYISNPTWYYAEVIPEELWENEAVLRRSVDTTLYANRIGNPRFKVGDLFYRVGADSDGFVPPSRQGVSLFHNLSIPSQLEVVGSVIRDVDAGKTMVVGGASYSIRSPVDQRYFTLDNGFGAPLDISATLTSNYAVSVTVVTLGSNELVVTAGPSFSASDVGTVIRIDTATTIATGDYVIVGVRFNNVLRVERLDGVTPSFFLEPGASGRVGAPWQIATRPALVHNPGYNYMGRLLKNHIFNVRYSYTDYPDIEYPRSQRDIRDVLLEGKSAYTYLLLNAQGSLEDEVGVSDDELLIVGKPALDVDGMAEVDGAFAIGDGTAVGTYYTYSGPQAPWYTTVRKDEFGTVTALPDSGSVGTLVFMYTNTLGATTSVDVELFSLVGGAFVPTGTSFTLDQGVSNIVTVPTSGQSFGVRVTSTASAEEVEGVSVGYIADTPSVLPRVAEVPGGSLDIVADSALFDVTLNAFDYRREVVISTQGTLRRFRIDDILGTDRATLIDVNTGEPPLLEPEAGVPYYFSAPRTSWTNVAVGGAAPDVTKTDPGNYIVSWPVSVTLQSDNATFDALNYYDFLVAYDWYALYVAPQSDTSQLLDVSGNGRDMPVVGTGAIDATPINYDQGYDTLAFDMNAGGTYGLKDAADLAPVNVAQGARFMLVVSHNRTPTPNAGRFMEMRTGGGDRLLLYAPTTASFGVFWTTGITTSWHPASGELHTMAAVNESGVKYELWANGHLVSVLGFASASSDFDVAPDFSVGADNATGGRTGGEYHLAGAVKDVSVVQTGEMMANIMLGKGANNFYWDRVHRYRAALHVYAPFNDPGGTVALDGSGQANYGTYSGATLGAAPVTPQFHSSAALGSTAEITLPSRNWTGSSWTAFGWIRQNTASNRAVLSIDPTRASGGDISMFVISTNLILRWNDGTTTVTASTTSGLTVGVPAFWTISYDAPTDTIKIYFDGVLEGTSSVAGLTMPVLSTYDLVFNQAFGLAQGFYNHNGAGVINGVLDDDEILELATGTTPTYSSYPAPDIVYDFKGATGTSVPDTSGNANGPATLFGGATPLSGGVHLDGVSGYIDISACAGIVSATQEYTLAIAVESLDMNVWYAINSAAGGNVQLLLGTLWYYAGGATLSWWPNGPSYDGQPCVLVVSVNDVGATNNTVIALNGVVAWDAPDPSAPSYSATHLWSLGHEYDPGPTPSNFTEGVYKECLLWNQPLSLADIRSVTRDLFDRNFGPGA